MSKVLVIPDIHLKTHILAKAETIIEAEKPDKLVFLGDYGDDWGQVYNVLAYENISVALETFNQKFDCHFLLGNHDLTYILNQRERYTLHDHKGYRDFRFFLKELNPTLALELDGVVYSHAGIINDSIGYYKPIDELEYGILTDIYLSSDSPTWLRPQNFWVDDSTPKLQIIGHTPVQNITVLHPSSENTLILTDVFSTHPKTREQQGPSSFIIVENGKARIIQCQ